VALEPLTVDFHEPGFVSELSEELRGQLGEGFAFQRLSSALTAAAWRTACSSSATGPARAAAVA
jgi:hypothetical protein